MAQLMAALRGQVRQTATRGWAVFAPSSRQSATSRSMFTSCSNFFQRSQPIVRPTAGNCLQGHLRQFCNKPPTANSTKLQKSIGSWRIFSLPSTSGLFNLFGYGGTIALILTAVGMYFENQRNKLAHVNDQLSKLYGPLYGNRQATRRIYTKVLSGDFYKEGKDYGTLEEYLEVTRERWLDSDEESKKRGRKMLTRWRRFLLTVIHPLDKEAEKIIRANAHLIEDSENNAEIFCKFIFHVNYEKFIVAKWVDRDFVVGFQEKYRDKDFDSWNNTGTLDKDTADSNLMLLELEEHVDETYKKLVKRQKKLMESWFNR
ncbi:uncharacterized protein LOC144910411 [Branchiostoma floridae x Branchiostoma belcheri]